MRVKDLIEQLSMFPEDWGVYIVTCPEDVSQPLTRKLISVCEVTDTRGGETKREQPVLLLTAFIKEN